MLRTYQEISEYLKDRGHLFMLWDEDDTFVLQDRSYNVDFMSIFLSLSGTIKAEINLKPFVADPDHLQIFMHDQNVRITECSEDYRSIGILISRNFWDNTLIHSHPFTTFSLVQPYLEVTPAQRKILVDFFRYIRYVKQEAVSDNDVVLRHLILGLFYEIGGFYEQWSTTFPKGSNLKLISDFISLLYENFKFHKDVAFYADALAVSKRHFSSTIKNTTGLSASRCIENYVVMKAASMLKNTDMSIKEIAMELDFDDTSHFCKYFRRNVGTSPDRYRKSLD